MNPHFKLPFIILLLICSACSVNSSKSEKPLLSPSNSNLTHIEQALPSSLKKTVDSASSETPITTAYLNAMSIKIHDKPQKYLKIQHHQDPKGPLLVSIENSSNLVIEELSLVSRLFDSKNKLIKHQSWQTKEAIKANSRSRYYLTPVTYHLQPGEKIKTTIQEVYF